MIHFFSLCEKLRIAFYIGAAFLHIEPNWNWMMPSTICKCITLVVDKIEFPPCKWNSAKFHFWKVMVRSEVSLSRWANIFNVKTIKMNLYNYSGNFVASVYCHLMRFFLECWDQFENQRKQKKIKNKSMLGIWTEITGIAIFEIVFLKKSICVKAMFHCQRAERSGLKLRINCQLSELEKISSAI